MYDYEKAMIESADNFRRHVMWDVEEGTINNATMFNVFEATEQYLTGLIENTYEMSIGELIEKYNKQVLHNNIANMDKAIGHDLVLLYNRYIHVSNKESLKSNRDFQMLYANKEKLKILKEIFPYNNAIKTELKNIEVDSRNMRYPRDKNYRFISELPDREEIINHIKSMEAMRNICWDFIEKTKELGNIKPEIDGAWAHLQDIFDNR